MERIKINKEKIIIALILIGFNQVDEILYSLVLDKMKDDFTFQEEEFSDSFKEFTIFNGKYYKMKDSYMMYSNQIYDKINWQIEQAMSIDVEIFKFLEKSIDYRELEIKKIFLIGCEQIESFNELFSDKEKEVIYNIFGKVEQKDNDFKIKTINLKPYNN